MAVGAAAEFEKQIDHFGAVTGATKEELKAVGNLALEMGRTTVYSANEAAGAMVELGKAGFTTKEILAGIGPAVASLAAAGDLPLTRATEVLANTIRTFGLEAKDAVYVADQLAGAANASTTEVEDLAVTLKYVGGVAAALGIPLHEVAAAMAILGNNGIKGSTAGTTLRRILLELNPATKKQTEALMELGIIQENANFSAEQLATAQGKVTDANNRVAAAQERVNSLTNEYARAGAPATAAEAAKRAQELTAAQEDLADAQENSGRVSLAYENTTKGLSNAFFHANGEAKSLGEIFQIVEDRTKHLNAAEKQRTLDIIFGSRAIAGALILAREGAEGFESISAQIEKVSAADVAAQRLDNLSGSLRRLKNILITEMVEAATPLLSILDGLVKFITKLVTSFGDLPAPIRQITLVALALFGVMAVLGGGMLLLVSFIARGVRAFGELRAVMIGTNVAKKALDANVPILAGRMGILTKAIHLLLSPFKLLWGLLVTAVTAIAAFLGVSVGVVVAVIAIVAILAVLIWRVKAVREFFISLGEAIVGFFTRIPGYLETAQHAIGGFFAMIVDRAAAVLSSIGGFFSSLPGIIGGALSTALSAVVSFITSVANFFMSLPGIIIGFLGQVLAAVGNFLVQLPERLAYTIGFMIGLWLRFWIEFYTTLITWTVQLIVGIGAFFTRMFEIAIEWVPKIIGAIIEWFEQLPGRVIGFLDATWDGFYAWAGRMVSAAIEMGSNVLSAVVEWFSQLPGRVADFINQTYDNVSAWADRMWDRAWQLGTDFVSALVDTIQALPGRIAGILVDIINNVVNWANSMWEWGLRAGSNMWEGVVQGIGDLPGVVWDIVQRVIDAFLSMVGSAWNAAKSLAGALWNGFKAGLGISSPSFIERAMWNITGNMGDSIKDLKKQVGTIQGLAMDVANPMSMNFNSPTALASLREQAAALRMQGDELRQQAQNVFNNEFHTNADPQEISSEIMWQQLVRVR